MVYKEEVRDLFTVPQGYMLAYCISADFNLFSEIEKQFCERYDMENRLFADYGSDFDGVGMALEIDNVYNLVTKRYAHNKPTYENLAMTLENMKDSMICEGQKKLAMPRICCGLNGLNWRIVRSIIKDIFRDTNIEILVCARKEDFVEEDFIVDAEGTDYEDYKYDKIDEYECDCKECQECSSCDKEDTTLEEELPDEDLKKVYYAILEELEKRHKYVGGNCGI